MSLTRLDEFVQLVKNNQLTRSAELPAPEPYVPPELTLLQTVALLRMNPSTLSRGVATRLLRVNDCQDYPAYSDYCELAKHRYCERIGDNPRHEITGLGMARAGTITRTMARELGVHMFKEGSNTGATGHYSCPGCDWSWYGQRGKYTEQNAYGSWARHHADGDEASPSMAAEG